MYDLRATLDRSGTRFARWMAAGLVIAGLTLTAACGSDVYDEPDGGLSGSRAAPVSAARDSQGSQNAPNAQGAAEADAQDAQAVTIVASDGMRFDPAAITVEAGKPVRLTFRNDGNATHDFTLSQGASRPVHLVAKRGETASATFTLAQPGTYGFVCSQFGHSMAGMKGTITAQ
jgi:plastocyanin